MSLETAQHLLLDALGELGPGWHSRADIAAHLGKNRLTGYDVAALELLVGRGEIEAERHELDAPIRERWEYRTKEGKHKK